MTKFGFEVLTGKALSFWLEFIDKTGEKFFVYKCKLSFKSALLYLHDLFINKLKTKCNNLFLQNDFKYKNNSQLLLKKFPHKSWTNAFKSFVRRQEKATAMAVQLLRAKIVIVGFKIIIFVLNYLTVLVYTKTIIHLSVGGFAAR